MESMEWPFDIVFDIKQGGLFYVKCSSMHKNIERLTQIFIHFVVGRSHSTPHSLVYSHICFDLLHGINRSDSERDFNLQLSVSRKPM